MMKLRMLKGVLIKLRMIKLGMNTGYAKASVAAAFVLEVATLSRALARLAGPVCTRPVVTKLLPSMQQRDRRRQ